MKSTIKALCIGLFLTSTQYSCAQHSPTVKVQYVTLEKGEAQPIQEITEAPTNLKIGWKERIFVQPEVTFQTIEGIGGAFNENGGEALASLKPAAQAEVMQNLFAQDNAGFTFCRTAIGASDFGLDAYSYSNTPDDYNMDHFSIDRDKKYVIPYIQGALKVNPKLTIFGSPWSPPAWMKTSNSMTGLTGDLNTIRREKKIFEAYAKYFVKYVQAYADNGIDVDRICIQNECDTDTKYPSCAFPAKEMVGFANQYIIPEFKKNNIKTAVYAGTFRAVNQMDLMDFVMCEDIGEVAGVGIQYTKANILTDALMVKPGLKMFHTEGHCYKGDNSVEEAKDRLEEVASYINSGCTTFTYWNMILNETTLSGWDWAQNSLINIDRKTGHVQYNPDYNAMYIISKFIKPGDVRVASINRGKMPMITVKSPDGTVKVLIQSTNNKAKTFAVVVGKEEYKVTVPGQAIAAITINK